MNIIQLYEEKENQDCFEFLDFLTRTASIVDEKGHKLVVRNGSKEITIQTSSGKVSKTQSMKFGDK